MYSFVQGMIHSCAWRIREYTRIRWREQGVPEDGLRTPQRSFSGWRPRHRGHHPRWHLLSRCDTGGVLTLNAVQNVCHVRSEIAKFQRFANFSLSNIVVNHFFQNHTDFPLFNFEIQQRTDYVPEDILGLKDTTRKWDLNTIRNPCFRWRVQIFLNGF